MSIYTYVFIAASSIILDRVTKWYALTSFIQEKVVNDFLAFNLSFNRGISWGFFNGVQPIGFWLVTAAIIIVIGMVVRNWWQEYRAGRPVLGQTLVLAGAVSNCYDRFVFGGVIDFIILSYASFVWPSFNIADCAIVVGAMIMLYYSLQQSPTRMVRY